MVDAIKVYFSNIWSKLLSIAKYIIKSLRFITVYIILLLSYLYGFKPLFLAIPIIVWVITSVLNIYLNKKNLGDNIPVPNERFTEDVGDGEITIRNDRIQELILYTNDLENWLKEKGYTKQ